MNIVEARILLQIVSIIHHFKTFTMVLQKILIRLDKELIKKQETKVNKIRNRDKEVIYSITSQTIKDKMIQTKEQIFKVRIIEIYQNN